jgi:hypothetical protein
MDVLGNVLYKKQNIREADLSLFAKGIYFLKVSDNATSYTKRIIVK